MSELGHFDDELSREELDVVCAKAAGVGYTDPREKVTGVVQLLASGNLEAALELIENPPLSEDGLVKKILLGKHAFESRNYPEAVRLFSEAIEEYPTGGYCRASELGLGLNIVLSDRGIAYVELGQPEKAIPDYEAILRSEPENFAACNNLGVAKRFNGDYEGALEILNLAAMNDICLMSVHAHSLVHYNLGLTKTMMWEKRDNEGATYPSKEAKYKALHEAIAHFTRVIDNGEAHIKMARHHRAFARYYIALSYIENSSERFIYMEGAEEDLTWIIDDDNDSLNYIYSRGVIRTDLKKFKKAIADLVVAKYMASPDNTVVQETLSDTRSKYEASLTEGGLN